MHHTLANSRILQYIQQQNSRSKLNISEIHSTATSILDSPAHCRHYDKNQKAQIILPNSLHRSRSKASRPIAYTRIAQQRTSHNTHSINQQKHAVEFNSFILRRRENLKGLGEARD
ncbi:hypothetical protein Nepgr_030818 [Nepenthes gracilis]|uniref:Uncharacterized protein n=1 Tax=Nepenthes gracilis TaxID=150966 RepID=A0AAD3TG47_NEPGR|nr:hypothetical protein Nepgr_030818 [Nepenthes gracilis]